MNKLAAYIAIGVVFFAFPSAWPLPKVYVIEELDERPIDVIPREPSVALTVDVYTYLYLPEHESYSPLDGVKVFIAPLDVDRSPGDWIRETNADGYARLTLHPYEPVNLLFSSIRLCGSKEVQK